MVTTRTMAGSRQTDVMSVRHRARIHFFTQERCCQQYQVKEVLIEYHVRSRTSSSLFKVVSLINRTRTMEGSNA